MSDLGTAVHDAALAAPSFATLAIAAAAAVATAVVPLAARAEVRSDVGRGFTASRVGLLERVPWWLAPLAFLVGEIAWFASAPHQAPIGVAAAIIVVCVWTDLGARRIFDLVLVLLVLVAIGRIQSDGLFAVLAGLGIGVPVLALALFPRIRVLGDGDVKLILALAAAIGYWPALVTIEAAILGVLVTIAWRRLRRTRAIEQGLPMAPYLAIGLCVATLASRA